MKDLPPLAGWPTQTSFVHERRRPPKKRHALSRHQKKSKRK